MDHFADRLCAAIKKCGNPICLGLDPRYEQLPEDLRKDAVLNSPSHTESWRFARAAAAFNRVLLSELADLVPAVKVQVAFYERYGLPGLEAFEATLRTARELGYVVIADVKRGDIGATAEAYAQAYLVDDAPFECDAITVNPYMGMDTLVPFVKAAGEKRGVFVLVKTSNPGSGDIQDLLSTREDERGLLPCTHTFPVYERVAGMLSRIIGRDRGEFVGDYGYSNIGMVVGATHPQQLASLRAMCPDRVLLIPGYGAQGGKADDVVLGLKANGSGAIVNNSRGLYFAFEREPYKSRYGPDRFAEAAKAAAEDMARELKDALARRAADKEKQP